MCKYEYITKFATGRSTLCKPLWAQHLANQAASGFGPRACGFGLRATGPRPKALGPCGLVRLFDG